MKQKTIDAIKMDLEKVRARCILNLEWINSIIHCIEIEQNKPKRKKDT